MDPEGGSLDEAISKSKNHLRLKLTKSSDSFLNPKLIFINKMIVFIKIKAIWKNISQNPKALFLLPKGDSS